mgnify:CR=1 FL=1
MLANIKSSFFLKHLFNHLFESKKLKIIKHNKILQNKIDISIIYYKIFSGRYIVYETKENIKEYNSYTDHLIYEGEYLNGERNGKGKEYNKNRKIIYSGEYLNGKRNGLGKEYYYNGKLYFEGEYSLGNKWNGKGYNIDGTISYEIKNGNGNIKEFNDRGSLIFEGEYLKGQKNGKGKEYYIEYSSEHGIKFEGEYLYNKRWNGKGYDKKGNVIYELKNGKGLIKEYDNYRDTLLFEGEYINGERNGKGKDYDIYNAKLKFEGEYLMGKRKGKGIEYDSEGKIKYEGEYLYDHLIKGKEFINEKLEYEGDFLFDKKWNGKGYDENGNIKYQLTNGTGTIEEYNNNNELIYKGEYSNGKRNGKGKEYEDGELIFEGIFLNNERKEGKEFYSDGSIFYEGEYLHGLKNGKGKEYSQRGLLLFEGEYLNGEQWNGKCQNKLGKVFELKDGIRK